MARIVITEHDENTGETRALGWFDPQAEGTEIYQQDTRSVDGNTVGVITHSAHVDEFLYRTAGGRWVHNLDARRDHAGPDIYTFVDGAFARDWLIRSEKNDEAIEKYFGPLPSEDGPAPEPYVQ